MRAVTIDEKSVSAAGAGQLDFDLFCNDFTLPPSDQSTKCAVIGEHGYILSRKFQPNDALLTISLTEDGPLRGLGVEARREALGRLIRVTMMLVSGRIRSIPVAWRAFHTGNRLSFQADRLLRSADGGRTDAGRVVIDISSESGHRVFAFLLDQEARGSGRLQPPEELRRRFPLLERHSYRCRAKGRREGLCVMRSLLDSEFAAKGRASNLDDWYKTRFCSPAAIR